MRVRNISFPALLCAFLSFSPLVADEIQLIPSMDNTLFEDDAGELSSGKGNHVFAGTAGGGGSAKFRRALLAFDTSMIPIDSVINSVELKMTINKAPPEAVPSSVKLYVLTASWGEGDSDAGEPGGQGAQALPGDATWTRRFYDTIDWTTAGGDFVPTSSQTALFGTGVQDVVFQTNEGLVADVQAWVDDPSSNFGWIMIGDESNDRNARRFYSREAIESNPLEVPILTIDFTPPTVFDDLVLEEIADGLVAPITIANAGDGSNRLFIIEQAGIIRVFDTQTQTLLPAPYLDIQALVDDTELEQGLLGLAFHPDFSSNRQFYVHYTRDLGEGNLDRSVVARYTQSLADANLADNTGTSIMEFEQDQWKHNGGDMHFGADGYLYIASGDGGGSGDPFENAQNVNTLKGAMLRIDVDSAPPRGVSELCGISPSYGIPAGNAFPGDSDGCDEILHIGLRNPWRFSFDAVTEEMYIADVGQGRTEEVNLLSPGESGLNFGWPCFEGTLVFDDMATCPNPVEPIFEYQSGGTNDCAIIGGYVFRGNDSPITGHYIYGDYCSGRIWAAIETNGEWLSVEWQEVEPMLESITAFGQDEFCEIYVVDAIEGKLFRIRDLEIVKTQGFEEKRCG